MSTPIKLLQPMMPVVETFDDLKNLSRARGYKEKGFKKLVTQRQGSILSKKERSILEREKPKEVKKKKRKTGGFF